MKTNCKTNRLSSYLCCILLAGTLSSSLAQVFQNGNFASPGGTFGPLQDNTPGLVLNPGSTFVTGWVTTDNITAYNGPGRYNNPPGSTDDYSFELGAAGLNGGIQQTFATIANTPYKITFWMTSFWLAWAPPELTVSAANQSANFQAGPASRDRFNVQWELREFNFTSDGTGLTTLKFQNVTAPTFLSAAEIDNVQVLVVPEPGVVSLAGVSLLLLSRRLFKP